MEMLPVMAIGDTPVDTWTLTLPGNNTQTLEGAVASGLSLTLHDKQQGILIDGNGTFDIVDAAAGVVTYAWDANDSAKAGVFQIAVKVIFTNGQQSTFGIVNRVTQTIVNI